MGHSVRKLDRNAMAAGQDLPFCFAEEHAFLYQPVTNRQCCASGVPHQRGGLRRRELQEDVVNYIRHWMMPAEWRRRGGLLCPATARCETASKLVARPSRWQGQVPTPAPPAQAHKKALVRRL
eukprot:5575936-Amphidinium_carterae.1